MTDAADATARPIAVSDFFQPPPQVDPELDPEIDQELEQELDPDTEPEADPQVDPATDPQSNQQSGRKSDGQGQQDNNARETHAREHDEHRQTPEQPPANGPAEGSQPEQSTHADPALDPALDRAAVERLYRRGLINLDAAKRAAAIIRGEAPAFRNQTPPKQSPNQPERKPRPSPSRRTPVIPDDYEDTHPMHDRSSQQPAQGSPSRESPPQQRPPQEAAHNRSQDTDDHTQQRRTQPQQPTAPPPQDQEFLGRWSSLIKTLSRSKGEKFNLGALLRDCPTQQLRWDGGLLTAQFRVHDNLNRLKEELTDPQMVELVQTAFRAEFGPDAQITFTGPRD